MKHLRKFNEGKKEDDFEYLLKSCEYIFAELIDDKKIEFERDEIDNLEFISISAKVLPMNKSNVSDMSEYVNQYTEYLDIVGDLDVCVKRLKDEIPNAVVDYQSDHDTTGSINIHGFADDNANNGRYSNRISLDIYFKETKEEEKYKKVEGHYSKIRRELPTFIRTFLDAINTKFRSIGADSLDRSNIIYNPEESIIISGDNLSPANWEDLCSIIPKLTRFPKYNQFELDAKYNNVTEFDDNIIINIKK